MIQAVVFDWGNTLMRVFLEYEGPMAYWPRVEAMPGVTQALAELHARYRLILATNAPDSDARLVRSALRRVGLEKYLTGVFSANELEARKPDPGFYHAVMRETGCGASEAVMVGDDYQNDITAAKQAGLWTVWYNPTAAPSPRSDRLHDVEIRTMAELPATLGKLILHEMDGC